MELQNMHCDTLMALDDLGLSREMIRAVDMFHVKPGIIRLDTEGKPVFQGYTDERTTKRECRA